MPSLSNGQRIEIYSAHAGGTYWKNLTDRLKAKGFVIEERYGVSDEEYRATKGKIGKLLLRWKMYAGYPLSLAKALFPKQVNTNTLRLAITTPFYLPALVRAFSGRSIPTVNLINDVFPEALIYSGMPKVGGMANRALAWVTRYALKNCSASVFVGQRLQLFCEENYGPTPKAKVIPVGSDRTWFQEPPSSDSNKASRPIALYSGAMGYMHEIETLCLFLKNDFSQNIQLRIQSFGVGFDRFKRQVTNLPAISEGKLVLGGALKHAQWLDAMKTASIGVISLKKGAEDISFPSKTFSALMAGQAILGICSKSSDLAKLIERHNCGWVIEPGDSTGLREVFEQISRQPQRVDEKRLNAYRAGHEYYSLEAVECQWLELFEELRKKKRKSVTTVI